jgi:hypothetical protein
MEGTDITRWRYMSSRSVKKEGPGRVSKYSRFRRKETNPQLEFAFASAVISVQL